MVTRGFCSFFGRFRGGPNNKRLEGLVHISDLRDKGHVSAVTDVVERHKAVKVKVIRVTAAKLSLSMKEVDQETGEDLNPQNTKRIIAAAQSESFDNEGGGGSFSSSMAAARNPDRPYNAGGSFNNTEDDLFGQKVS